MKKIMLFIAILFLVGCTKNDDTKRILSDQGFTNIETTGYRPFACGDDYTFQTGFAADAPVTKKRVTGVVCSGILKGSSVKFD